MGMPAANIHQAELLVAEVAAHRRFHTTQDADEEMSHTHLEKVAEWDDSMPSNRYAQAALAA